jgi:hypothetical protein
VVFIIGFLLSGTAADFKEAERLPGELSASLASIADECLIIDAELKRLHARLPQSLMSTARAYPLSSAAIFSRSLICWMSTVAVSVGQSNGPAWSHGCVSFD